MKKKASAYILVVFFLTIILFGCFDIVTQQYAVMTNIGQPLTKEKNGA